MAALDLSSANDERYWITPARYQYQPTDRAILRGTVVHERRAAEEAVAFLDDGHLLLRVTCRATAGELAASVRYALAVSFEVGVDAGVQVYEQMRQRLAARVRAAVPAA